MITVYELVSELTNLATAGEIVPQMYDSKTDIHAMQYCVKVIVKV